MATNQKSALQRNWFILSSLVSKDFKLKYRRSVLGVLWSVLNPLLMMIVLSAVFSTFFRFDIENSSLSNFRKHAIHPNVRFNHNSNELYYRFICSY